MAAYTRLSVAEREIVHKELAMGSGCNAIARKLRRDKSTLSREIRRLGGSSKNYSLFLAQTDSEKQQASRKTGKRKIHNRLAVLIEQCLLKNHFSPEQISHPTFPTPRRTFLELTHRSYPLSSQTNK
jgi:transposase, IS30 family